MVKVRKAATIAVSVVLLATLFFSVSPSEFAVALSAISPNTVVAILAICGCGVLVASYRLFRLTNQFGLHLHPRVAIEATAAGLLGGSTILNFFGSIVGRHVVLRRWGASASMVSVCTVYEKLAALLVSAGLAGLGLVVLSGDNALTRAISDMPLVEIAIVFAIAVGLSVYLSNSRAETVLLRRLVSLRAILRFGEIAAITAIGQGLLLVVFLLILTDITGELDPVQMAGGAAVVMFAASLPISINGWGVREFASVMVFGQIGVSPEVAITVSVLVGLAATASVALMSTALIRQKKVRPAEGLTVIDSAGAPRVAVWDRWELDALLARALGIIVAVAMFFQVSTSVGTQQITLGLSDPLALLALTFFALLAYTRRGSSVWLASGLKAGLIAMGLVLLGGFAIGYVEHGLSNWAVTNRVLGGLVLFGYVSAGALMVLLLGRHGFHRLCETVVVAATVVVLSYMIQQLLVVMEHGNGLPGRFEGYSANRNAFAFLLLMALACALGIWRTAHRSRMAAIWTFMTGVILVGIWITGSRAGILTAAGLISAVWLTRIAGWRVLVSLAIAAAIYGVLVGAVYLIFILNSGGADVGGGGLPEFMATPVATYGGDNERWASLVQGIRLWLDEPVSGAGLGAFVRLGLGHDGSPLVIHNIYVWLLAEFGIVGFAVVAAAFVGVAAPLRRVFGRALDSRQRVLLLALLGFLVFGLVHDIFYQRSFWLLIGATCAVPAALRLRRPRRDETIRAT